MSEEPRKLDYAAHHDLHPVINWFKIGLFFVVGALLLIAMIVFILTKVGVLSVGD